MTRRRTPLVRAAKVALLALVWNVLSSSIATKVHAFSDPASFATKTAAAGGGGRYFTGSPADGYTCKVCHEGGVEPSLRVLGLPLAGYSLGTSYEIVVDWPDNLDKIAAVMEITDLQGQVAGSVRLPPQAELLPAEACEPASDAIPAASLLEAPNGRQIISVPDCGAKQLRLLWTAPLTDRGRIWFAGSAVTSDGAANVTGDGVTDFGRVIGSASSAQPAATQISGGCTVSKRSQCKLAWPWLVVLGVCAMRARGRRAAKTTQ